VPAPAGTKTQRQGPQTAPSWGGELFGREGLIGEITPVLQAARRSQGGAVVLRGPAGIGKSSLLTVARSAGTAAGMLALAAKGVRNESGLPFAGLHQLIRPLLSRLTQLPAEQAALLRSAFGDSRAGADRLGIALATLDLFAEAAAQQPILVLADDAQWLDGPTTDVLAFIGRRLAIEPIAMVACVRDSAADPFADAELPVIRVGPLSEAAARALLRANSPSLSRASQDRLLEVAQGNPLALIELPKAADDAIPSLTPLTRHIPVTAVLERAFTHRVAALPRPARLLLLAAASDDACTTAEILQVAGTVLDVGLTLQAFQPAVDAHLITITGNRVAFSHPLVSSAIYSSAPVEERRLVHAALAQIVPAGEDRHLWHCVQASIGVDDGLANELERLAERTAAQGAGAVAVTALERAAGLSSQAGQRADRLLRAAELAAETGRPAASLELLQRADVTVLSLPRRARAMIVRELAEFAPLPDADRLPILVETVTDLAESGEAGPAAFLLWKAATKCWRASAGPGQRGQLLDATLTIGLAGDDVLLAAVRACADPLTWGTDVLSALARVRSGPRDMGTSAQLARAALFVGDYPQARRHAAEGCRVARGQGRLSLVTQLALVNAQAALWCGNLDEAAAAAAESRRSAGDTGQSAWATLARVQEALVDGLRGDYPAAAAQVRRAEDHPELRLDHHAMAGWQWDLGLAALALGEHQRAFDHLRRIADPGDPAYHFGLRHAAVGDLAEAARGAGRLPEVRDLIEHLLRDMTGSTPGLSITARHARLMLSPDGHAEAEFSAALAADLSARPLARARLLLAHGAWLRRRRRPVAAREPLRAARELFDTLGITGWSARARVELEATGEASQESRPATWSTLTPQEWQIAQLAAAGMTNSEIGEQLLISRRTVGSHLYHLFPKLGVTARSQLANALCAAEPTTRQRPGRE
jgi:DNA-binding CsgD family transcriptional regulator/tetratricopeptide (TPR) repeat protein